VADFYGKCLGKTIGKWKVANDFHKINPWLESAEFKIIKYFKNSWKFQICESIETLRLNALNNILFFSYEQKKQRFTIAVMCLN